MQIELKGSLRDWLAGTINRKCMSAYIMEVLALSLCVERVLRLDYQQVGHIKIVKAEIISLDKYLVHW